VRVVICEDARSLGRHAAAEAAAGLNEALSTAPRVRLLLATGESQLETLAELVRRPVDWARVDAFHLDEYIGLPSDHPASFRRYLKERVADLVPLIMHYVDPSSPRELEQLGGMVASAPMDVALVGIGENGHLAFNDPPADLVTTDAYLEVGLAERCRAQQVREGWFGGVYDVPQRAVTMSVSMIMRSLKIISAVPHTAKAPVMRDMLASAEVTADLPASALRQHADVTVFLDRGSSGLLPRQVWERCVVL
jgi:glucosamine-6-phosphate deaminase